MIIIIVGVFADLVAYMILYMQSCNSKIIIQQVKMKLYIVKSSVRFATYNHTLMTVGSYASYCHTVMYPWHCVFRVLYWSEGGLAISGDQLEQSW